MAFSRRMLVVLLAVALSAAACGNGTSTSTTGDVEPSGSSTTTEQPASTDSTDSSGGPRGTLVVAQGVDPRTFSPWTSVAAELSVTTQIFERLIAFNLRSSEYDPILAETYSFVDDVTLEMQLRDGVVFSNGEAFDADAAIFSLEQLLDPEVGGIELSNRTANIQSVEKVDDRTIRFNFIEPIAQSLNLANLSQSTFMVPPAYFQEVGFESFIAEPIGSGPFVLEERVRDSQIVLVANDLYAGHSGEAPGVERIEFRILPEPGTRVSALEAGDVDIVVDLPFEEADRIGDSDGIEIVSIPGLRVMELQVDMRHGLSEASQITPVRQALLYALDRQLIIDTVFLGQGSPVTHLAAPGYFGFVEDLPPLEYNPDRVADLLAEAGFPDGVELPLVCPAGRYLKDAEVCQVIAAEFAKVNITASLETMEVGAYFEGVLAGTVGPMIYIGRLAPSLNVVDMYNSSLCGSSDSYKCDEELDALQRAARTATDPSAQRAAIAEMVRFDLEDPNRIPLWVLNDVYAVSTDVAGWEPRADQVLEFWGVSINE